MPKTSLTLALREQVRQYEMTVFSIKGMKVGGTVIRLDDISDRLRMRELIIQSEKIESVGSLVAGMAHELNNPLSGILQSQQIDSLLAPDFHKNLPLANECGVDLEQMPGYLPRRGISQLLQAAQDSGVRAAKIIENMLNFRRMEDLTTLPQAGGVLPLGENI